MHPQIRNLLFHALTVLLLLLPIAAGASEVLKSTLDNGLRVVIVRNDLAPAVAVQVNYLVGSQEAPPGFPGMAHAQEHMMFRGSPALSAEQLSTLTAAMGGDFNAETEQVVTRYLSTVAAQDLEAVLNLEAARMGGVLDSEQAWREERGAIEQEVDQDLSNPEYLLGVRLQERLFADTPYEQDPLGSRASFDRTTAAMLKKFYHDWYAPNNTVLVIVGAVDPGRTAKLVRRLFGTIPARKLPARPEVVLKPLIPEQIELPSNLPYGLASLAYRLPGYQSPDFAAGQVLGDVLESKRGSLYALVPAGKALDTGFEGIMLPKAGGAVVLAAFPEGGDGKALLGELRRVIAGYLKDGIPAELVEAAKRHEIAGLEFQKGSLAGLASAWSQAVAVEGRSSPEEDVEAIRRVSVEDVNRVARGYLINDSALSALLVPRASGEAVEAKGMSRGQESFAAKNVQPVKLPTWGRKISQVLPSLSEKRPADYRLANGLRLIVVSAPASGAVRIFGQVKNKPSLQTPAGKEGVDELLDGLFAYGTSSLDRLAFLAALDEIAADLRLGTSFSLTVLKEHFGRGVELMADGLLHPALPAQAFQVLKEQLSASLPGRLQSSQFLVEQSLKEKLFPKGDPSLRHPVPKSVASLTLEDVKRYHREVLRPDLTTLVVIGDLKPEEVKGVIERYFGAWRGEGPRPPTELPPVPLNKSALVAVPDASRVQDEVTLAETLGLTRSHPDYYPLELGLNVLTGGFYATRLYRDLRERAGLVYTVEAFFEFGKTRASFGVFYGCEPGNVSKAQAMVERELERMGSEPVQPLELQRAKTLVLREMLLERTSSAGIAGKLLDLALLDLPLDEPERAARLYQRIGAGEVRRAFAKWLRPADLVRVSRGPTPK